MQRLRIRFGRGEETRYISHLDLMRLWQRAFNRAGIDLAYSEGFNPHPRMSLAAPLALGVTSEAELMDVVLTRWSSPQAFISALKPELPRGIVLDRVMPVGPQTPSLQSLVRFADYRVELPADRGREQLQADIDALLEKETLPWQHKRDTGPHKYDLRKLINDIWLEDDRAGCLVIGMRLQCDSNGSGRPEQVALALGFERYPLSIHRTRLILEAK